MTDLPPDLLAAVQQDVEQRPLLYRLLAALEEIERLVPDLLSAQELIARLAARLAEKRGGTMTPEQERLFDEQFVQDYDNVPGQGPQWLFHVWPDGTRSIAKPEHVKAFINRLLGDDAPAAPPADPPTRAEPPDDEPPLPIQPGPYRHYKGGVYTVLHIGDHTETGTIQVVYRGLTGRVWVRPASIFAQSVFYEGQWVRRFTRLALIEDPG